MEHAELIAHLRRGEAHEIAAAIGQWLGQALEAENLTVKASLQRGSLQLLLAGDTVPNAAIVPRIAQILQPLQGEFANRNLIQSVRISAQQTGDLAPTWVQEVTWQQLPKIAQAGNFPATETDLYSSNLSDPRSELRRLAPPNPAGSPLPNAKGSPAPSSEFWQSLRTFDFATMVPYREALSPELYGHSTVKLLLFFGLFPLAVSFLVRYTNLGGLERTAWVLGIYYAAIWGVVLHTLIRPIAVSWQEILKCVLFTIFIGIPLLFLFQRVPPFSFFYTVTNWGGVLRFIGFLGAAALEEITKALPIYLFSLKPKRWLDPLTFAFYGSMSGLGFAISEGALYSLQYAFGLIEGQFDFGAYVLVNTIRFVSLPLFHAIWAGILGYFMGLAAINPSRQGAILFIGLAIATGLHGTYNTFANEPIGVLIMAFSILLFIAYLQRTQTLVEAMRQAESNRKGLN